MPSSAAAARLVDGAARPSARRRRRRVESDSAPADVDDGTRHGAGASDDGDDTQHVDAANTLGDVDVPDVNVQHVDIAAGEQLGDARARRRGGSRRVRRRVSVSVTGDRDLLALAPTVFKQLTSLTTAQLRLFHQYEFGIISTVTRMPGTLTRPPTVAIRRVSGGVVFELVMEATLAGTTTRFDAGLEGAVTRPHASFNSSPTFLAIVGLEPNPPGTVDGIVSVIARVSNWVQLCGGAPTQSAMHGAN